MGFKLNLWTKTAFLVTALLTACLAASGAAAPAPAERHAGDFIIGFHGKADAAYLKAHGLKVDRLLAGGNVAVAHTPDSGGALRALAAHGGVAFVTPNQKLSLDSSSWDGLGYEATTWDATTWDASSWDATTWDATTWDATTWDATTWDSSAWAASSWDATTWDATTWDANGTMDGGFDVQWGLGATRTNVAWETTYGTGSVTVCVLDTGVDYTHPDLQVNLLRDANGAYGYNAMNGTTYVMDDVGHGTHVAGILAATGGNGIGIAGVARSKVLAVKVMDANGGSEADLIAGIDHCISRGAEVASMSLHVDAPDAALAAAIQRAQDAGMLLVAAAGNAGSTAIPYPAAYAGVIAVGAVLPNGSLAGFSNHGSSLDLVAPGYRIASTALGGGYAMGSGTSQAVPFVAGAAALMWEKTPSRTSSQIASLLASTARDLGASGFDTTYGYGALDTGAAVQAA